MKSGIQCLITGCDLLVPAEGKWAHGDLHMTGTCFVFNACLHNGETLWLYRDQIPLTIGTDPEEPTARCIILDQPYYFERRGVIVFDALHSHFNQAAKDYLLPQLKEKQDGKETSSDGGGGGGFFARFLRSSRR